MNKKSAFIAAAKSRRKMVKFGENNAINVMDEQPQWTDFGAKKEVY